MQVAVTIMMAPISKSCAQEMQSFTQVTTGAEGRVWCTVTSKLGAAAKTERQRMSQKQTSNAVKQYLPNSSPSFQTAQPGQEKQEE